MELYGRQFTILLERCDEAALADVNVLIRELFLACEQGGLNIVSHLAHEFRPFGMTALFVLSQSHLAVHTWPEHRAVLLTLFVCQESFEIGPFVGTLADMIGSENVEIVTSFIR
jgi:S-adenosylmethionine/arginine decarboxylase-like enzyme